MTEELQPIMNILRFFMAHLGLADEAKQYLIERARNHNTDIGDH